MNNYICLLIIATTLIACQRKPNSGPASDNMSPLSPPPMGATVYNDELVSELKLLDDYFANKVSAKTVAVAKKALMEGDMAMLSGPANTDEARLAKIFMATPEIVHGPDLSDVRKKWVKGKFLFLQRRFVESSMLLSEVLKAEPDFHQARNWRARAIFFLGNPDLAFSELGLIANAKVSPREKLDALYLQGAMIYEMADADESRRKLGIAAWQNYLKLAAPDDEIAKEVTKSLAELKSRNDIKPATKPTTPNDIFSPQPGNSAEVNAALTAFGKEELLLAQELCERILKAKFDKVIALTKARILIKSGRMDEASALFKEIVTKEPKFAPAWHYQGMSFMLKGQVKEAIASWQKTFELDVSYAKSHNLDQRIAVAQGMVEPTKVPSH
jgi:tetratricopeptide (TPR) repeat protein